MMPVWAWLIVAAIAVLVLFVYGALILASNADDDVDELRKSQR